MDPTIKVLILVTPLLLLAGVAYVWLSWGSRGDLARLTELWGAYAARHGDRQWEPGRFAYLDVGEVLRYAQLDGVRNNLPFTARIMRFDTDDRGEQHTHFNCKPHWLPDRSWFQVSPESIRYEKRYASLDPALVAHRLVIYAEPPDVVSVFRTPDGARVLSDFARLMPGTTAMVSRNDEISRHYDAESRGPRASMRVPTWVVEPEQLDACIDVVTRLCALRRQ